MQMRFAWPPPPHTPLRWERRDSATTSDTEVRLRCACVCVCGGGGIPHTTHLSTVLVRALHDFGRHELLLVPRGGIGEHEPHVTQAQKECAAAVADGASMQPAPFAATSQRL
jgi:hypothetical protein